LAQAIVFYRLRRLGRPPAPGWSRDRLSLLLIPGIFSACDDSLLMGQSPWTAIGVQTSWFFASAGGFNLPGRALRGRLMRRGVIGKPLNGRTFAKASRMNVACSATSDF
jgi:hypothetical protein